MARFPMIAPLIALVVAACATSSSSVQPAHPRITLEYLPRLFDSICAAATQTTADASAMAETERRLPEFRRAWEAEEERLLSTTVQITGAGWRYREAVATLHVCEGMRASVTYPLIIDARPFLAATDGPLVGRDDALTNVIFHEVLHRYLRELIGAGEGQPMRSTPIMRQYESEPMYVRTHLHLYALQRAVYARVGRDFGVVAEFQATTLTPEVRPMYERAAALSEQHQEALLAELRTLASGRQP